MSLFLNNSLGYAVSEDNKITVTHIRYFIITATTPKGAPVKPPLMRHAAMPGVILHMAFVEPHNTLFNNSNRLDKSALSNRPKIHTGFMTESSGLPPLLLPCCRDVSKVSNVVARNQQQPCNKLWFLRCGFLFQWV